MNEVILAKVVQTCRACPSQWDAWDQDGKYWYLRYRNSRGTAERQPGPDLGTWSGKRPEIGFCTDRGRYDGSISLGEFCNLAGLTLRPDAEVISYAVEY